MVLGSEMHAELLELKLHRVLLPLHELSYECLLIERRAHRAAPRDRRGGRLGGPRRRRKGGGRRGQRVPRAGMLREGAWRGGN